LLFLLVLHLNTFVFKCILYLLEACVAKTKKPKTNYIDSKELEQIWAIWLDSECPKAWERLQTDIYKICEGVAVHFNPKNPEEHMELVHETFVPTIAKIRSKKLVFEPGRAPVFNFLTTTIFRHLYSLKNKQNRRRKLLKTKFLLKPGVMDKLVCASDLSGNARPHPESERILSHVMPSLKHETALLSIPKQKSVFKKNSPKIRRP